MKAKLEQIKVAALDAIAAAENAQDIDAVRVKYLGKKGELTAILKQMGGLSPEERPIMGQLVNSAKAELETVLEQKNAQMKAKATEEKLAAETIDITMPAKEIKPGKLHPLNTVLDDMINIWINAGKLDLKSIGIVDTLVDTPDDLVKTAIITYVLSFLDVVNAELYSNSYTLQKDVLRHINSPANMTQKSHTKRHSKKNPINIQHLHFSMEVWYNI